MQIPISHKLSEAQVYVRVHAVSISIWALLKPLLLQALVDGQTFSREGWIVRFSAGQGMWPLSQRLSSASIAQHSHRQYIENGYSSVPIKINLQNRRLARWGPGASVYQTCADVKEHGLWTGPDLDSNHESATL